MKIGLITCWYEHQIFSHYARDLREHLVALGVDVKIIASECGCGMSHKTKRTRILEKPDFFLRMPYPVIKHNFSEKRRAIAFKMAMMTNVLRGMELNRICPDCDLLHFQQVNDAFGAETLFSFLKFPTKTKKMVTVHELDPFQLHFVKLNALYNKAHRVFVYSSFMKKELMALGVEEEKLQVLPLGVRVEPLNGHVKNTIVYYGGHHLLSGKGFQPFLEALRTLKEEGYRYPVRIHGGFSAKDTLDGMQLASKMGLKKEIEWLGKVEGPTLTRVYQEGLLSVIPFTKGTGSFAATLSMANATPVVATDAVELPEYLGDAAVYVPVNNSAILAEKMRELLNDSQKRQNLAKKLRERAETIFSWENVAKQLLKEYEKALS